MSELRREFIFDAAEMVIAAKLTGLQERFVYAFVGEAHGNATEAARLAGYKGSNKYLSSVGNRNKRHPRIRPIIDRWRKLQVMSVDEVLARLTALARVSFEDFIEFEEGQLPYFDFTKAEERGALPFIKKFKVNRFGEVTLELCDPMDALKLIGNYHGLWRERVEHELRQSPLSSEEFAQAMAELEAWETELDAKAVAERTIH